jgi:hypothetical protein
MSALGAKNCPLIIFSMLSQINRQGTNDDARTVNGLVDLYTQIQQESLAQ